MYTAYLKNVQTARIYSRGLQVLFSSDFNWNDAGVHTSHLDEDELTKQMLKLLILSDMEELFTA